MTVRIFKFSAILCLSVLSVASVSEAIEINSPQAPARRPSIAPLPNSHYDQPQSNRNYQPQQTVPGGPTFKLNTGPDINHQQWCNSRYKSYRSSDDSYVDHGGVRQNCQSPFPR